MFGPLYGVGAMLLVDAAEEVGGVVVGGDFLLVDDIDAGLVECNGVGGGKDAVVLEFYRGGMIHAVAVDGHVVHHADVDDALVLLEIVDHSLGSCGHGLEESVLVPHVAPHKPEVGGVAGRVDVGLAMALAQPMERFFNAPP